MQPGLHFELQLGAEGQASPGLQPQPLEPGRRLLGDLLSGRADLQPHPAVAQQAPPLPGPPRPAGPAAGAGPATAARGAPTAAASSAASGPAGHGPEAEGALVPTLFVGKLYCPIAAGSPTLTLDMLRISKALGVDPPVPLPSLEQQLDVWRAARYTDALSAYNILQGRQVEGKTAIVFERNLAEQLAKGRVQMSPLGPAGSGAEAPPAPRSPLAALQRLAGRLRDGREIVGAVRQAVEQLPPVLRGKQGNTPAASSGTAAQGASALQQGEPPAAGAAAASTPAASPERGAQPAGQSASPVAGAPQQQEEQQGEPRELREQYSLQRVLGPLGGMLPPHGLGASPPQLAVLPVRVALQLLAGMPRRFLLLTDGNEGSDSSPKKSSSSPRPAQQQPQQALPAPDGAAQGAATPSTGPPGSHLAPGAPSAAAEAAQRAEQEAAAASLGRYCGTDSLSGVKVYTVVGLAINQSAGDGAVVQFTPAFLSQGQLRQFWRSMQVVSGSALMARRRLMRALMQQRMERAAAIIAGGGAAPAAGSGGSGGPASGGGGEEELGDDDEPPEINQFIQEIGQSLNPLAGLGVGGAPKGIARVAATMACGAVTLAARFMNWAGNAADQAVMATPLGPRLLGIPSEASFEEHTLSDLLSSYRTYNSQQRAALLTAPTDPAAAAAVGGSGADARPGAQAGAGPTPVPGPAASDAAPPAGAAATETKSAEAPAAAGAAEVAGSRQPAEGDGAAAAHAADAAAAPAEQQAGSSAAEGPSVLSPSQATTPISPAEPAAPAGMAAGDSGEAGAAAAASPALADSSPLEGGPSNEQAAGAAASALPGDAAPGPSDGATPARPTGQPPERDESSTSRAAAPATEPAGHAAAMAGEAPEAPGAGGSPQAAAPGPASGRAAGAEGQAAAAEGKGLYAKRLAAAALWLAVTGKLSVETQSLLGLLMRPGANSAFVEAPFDGLQAALDANATTPGDDSAASLAVLSTVLPTLEHNGLSAALAPRHSRLRAAASAAAAAAAAGTAGAAGEGQVQGQAVQGQAVQPGEGSSSLEEQVLSHASPQLELQIVHGKNLESSQLPVLTQPLGKGLILVGDLDLSHPWGVGRRGPGGGGRLLLGVDDGARLLEEAEGAVPTAPPHGELPGGARGGA